MSKLATVEKVIDAVGGAAAASALAGLKSESAAFNWIARKKIPPEHFLVFSREVGRLGKEIDPAVFGFAPEEARQ